MLQTCPFNLQNETQTLDSQIQNQKVQFGWKDRSSSNYPFLTQAISKSSKLFSHQKKTLCKQSQLIQIIEEVRSPKINKSLHDLQSLFKGEALVEASTLANLQVQQDNLLEQALLVGNQMAPCLGFHLRNLQ